MFGGETVGDGKRSDGLQAAGAEGDSFALSRLELSLGSSAAELALDEALLLEAESSQASRETLRVWSFASSVVVIGRGSKREVEVDREHCEREGIPVLRRCSGGAALVGGPGCLMYSVVLDLRRRVDLRRVDAAHAWVMSRLLKAVTCQVPGVRWQGTCDLTLAGRKFSGNSLRIARDHLLYHGTILHAADLVSLQRCLRTPPRQPDYRGGRDHGDFVTNVELDPARLTEDLAACFNATAPPRDWPRELTEQLLAERYSDPAWHGRH